MATVTLDIEEGHSASHDLLSGWDYMRVAMVEGLSPALSTDDLITQAEALLVSAVGNRGSKYQMGFSGAYVYLKAFVPEVIVGSSSAPTGAVKFRIVYRGYPILVYEFDGAVSQAESNIDVKQKVIAVSYTFPATYSPLPPGCIGNRLTKGIRVSRDEFEAVFTVRFLVVAGNLTVHARGQTVTLTNSNATNLMTAIGAYQGTCNDDTYTIGILVGTKHQWKIVRVTGVSHDQGLTYEASMSFQFRSLGWDKVVTFTDPNTGEPPADLIISTKKVTDSGFPEYAGIPPATTPDIGSTIAATADESTFPSFGDVGGATFPIVNN